MVQLPPDEQDDVLAACQDPTRRRGWIDREQHEYVVELDGRKFTRIAMDELLG